MTARRWLAQGLFWLAVVAATGYCAHRPRHSPLPPGHGELKLSVAHLTERLEPCRTLSAAERAKLPPNMRAPQTCKRGRVPARVELDLDGQPLQRSVIKPAGLSGDGRSYLHATWPLPAGRHRLELRLRDTVREAGFDEQARFEFELHAGELALLRVSDGDTVLTVAGKKQEQQ